MEEIEIEVKLTTEDVDTVQKAQATLESLYGKTELGDQLGQLWKKLASAMLKTVA